MTSNRFVMGSAAALLGGVVYLNALHNPFVYDDYHTVVANPSISSVANLRAIVLHAMTRPIVNFSYAFDRTLWGAGSFGFHLTNVLLHMVAVILLFQLARRVTDRPERADLVAFVTATLFAVHPMMTEAVGYISGRSEVLCATFFLGGLLCGRRWIRGDGRRWAVPTVGFWIAALATKEIGAMFPFVLFCYDWLTQVRPRSVRLKPDPTDDTDAVDALASPPVGSALRRTFLTIHLPLMAVAVVGGLVRLAVLARVEYPGQVTIHWSYLLIGADVVRRYAGLLFWPVGQTIFHEVIPARGVFDPRALMALGSIGLMVALAWRVRRVTPLASFGILWFLLLLVPSTVLIALNQGEPMAEHRVYLASCGLFLALGTGIDRLSEWLARASAGLRVLARVTFAIVVLSFGAETVVRNAVWSDPVRLWRESVDLAPTHYRPRLLLGEALADAGRRNEAIAEFKTAIRLRPAEPTGHVKLGESLADLGDLGSAREHFLEALRIDPQNVSAQASLTVLDKLEAQSGNDGARR